MIAAPWPGMMRTVAGDHARFEQTYFAPFKGLYFTGGREQACAQLLRVHTVLSNPCP